MHPILIAILKNWKLSLTIITLLVVGGYTSYLKHKISDLEETVTTVRFEKDSVEAVNDSTRKLALQFLDSANYYERRALQTRLERDSINEALNTTSRVRTSLQARIDSLQRVSQSDTIIQKADTTYATFNFYEKPYTVDAAVSVFPPPQPASLSIGISLDSLPVHIRVGCSPGEISKATLGVIVPDWVDMKIQDIRQAPGVCNPALEVPEEGFFYRNRGKLGISAGVIGTLLAGFVF